MNDKTAYPLAWPEGWPRVTERINSPFVVGSYPNRRHRSIDECRRFLADEVERLGAKDAILSTNLRLRLDGNPVSDQAQPKDVGAAVYFTLKGKAVSLACDKWRHVQCNIYAIAKHIEALRSQERWGVGNVEQAFRGYMALPGIGQTSGENYWTTLGVAVNATEAQISEVFKALAKKYHPDIPGTGNAPRFALIRQAHDMLMQNVRGKQ